VRSAPISNVTVWLNMPYIVCFGLYCPHGFVPGDASPLLSLTPQKTYNMLATNTINKTSYRTFTRRCEILHGLYVQHYLGNTPTKAGCPPNNKHAIRWWAHVFWLKPRRMPNTCYYTQAHTP